MATTQNTQTRTTAAVVKFICLYTRDLKRKHKRWQDGRLEFHTFNRRVMVYDDGGNFVGDSHRTKSNDVEDGDEFQLDRGNVIVQVTERVGQREQDITEIVARKPKVQENAAQSSTALLTPRTKLPISNMRHLPLQSLLSTPGRQIGRAVIPTTSPFDRRNQMPDDHRSKRRKLDTMRNNGQATTTVLLDPTPSPPRQPTTNPIPQDLARRKQFSPRQVRSANSAPVTAHECPTLGETSLGESNPARATRIDPSSMSSGAEKTVALDGCAPATECRQSTVTHTCRRTNTSQYKDTSMKRNLLPGKESQGAVTLFEKQEVPSGGAPRVTSNLVSKAPRANRPVEPRPPNEPTTALRLGSAQKRGLLVAKNPAKEVTSDKALAQLAAERTHATERLTDANPARGSAPVTDTGQPVANPALPANSEKDGGGQPVVMNHRTKTCSKGGPWSREASDLLDYKRSPADKPAT
ncbi:hypothetical protein VUR80DRAFT_3532 [Thermomyces stellatus]